MSKEYEITLTGLTPLLMHADDVDAADALAAARTKLKLADAKKSKAGDDRSPPATWSYYLYWSDDESTVTIPSTNIQRMLMDAGAQVSTGKRGTFKKESQTSIVVGPTAFSFDRSGKAVPLTQKEVAAITGLPTFDEQRAAARKLGFDLWPKRASVGAAKHVRVRAKFVRWTLRFTVTVLNDSITEEVLQQMFEYAGRACGLCDWRPSSPKRPGPYGTFTALVKLLSKSAAA